MPLIDTEKAWKTAQRIYSDPVLLHVIKNTLDSTETIENIPTVNGGIVVTTAGLKPCPFCGFSAELFKEITESGGEFYGVCCRDPHCNGAYIVPSSTTKEKAVEEWNRRDDNAAD